MINQISSQLSHSGFSGLDPLSESGITEISSEGARVIGRELLFIHGLEHSQRPRGFGTFEQVCAASAILSQFWQKTLFETLSDVVANCEHRGSGGSCGFRKLIEKGAGKGGELKLWMAKIFSRVVTAFKTTSCLTTYKQNNTGLVNARLGRASKGKEEY